MAASSLRVPLLWLAGVVATRGSTASRWIERCVGGGLLLSSLLCFSRRVYVASGVYVQREGS